ncbi:50S ribosomal protein L24 [Candidatus Purcelliella pentastirinorum]|nr:50S ribosomal protein L24 [Candidatus Purcelliella pentastirinorum]
MSLKIKCNDVVIVTVGKDKGKKGKVKSIYSSKKVIVEGINIVKKHQKSNSKLNNSVSGIVEKESPISISNVAYFSFKHNRSDRIGFKFINGKKYRFLKSTGEIIK